MLPDDVTANTLVLSHSPSRGSVFRPAVEETSGGREWCYRCPHILFQMFINLNNHCTPISSLLTSNVIP